MFNPIKFFKVYPHDDSRVEFIASSFQNNEIIYTDRTDAIKRDDLLLIVKNDGLEEKYKVIDSRTELHKQRITVKWII